MDKSLVMDNSLVAIPTIRPPVVATNGVSHSLNSQFLTILNICFFTSIHEKLLINSSKLLASSVPWSTF